MYITISSYTNSLFEGKKLNTLLRSVIILIADKIHPNISFIYSEALNATSAYLLINKFNAVQDTTNRRKKLPKTLTYENLKKYIKRHSTLDLKVYVNDPATFEKARATFNTVIEQIECQRGPISRGGVSKKHRPIRNKIKKYTRKSKVFHYIK
jgi:hypothetical protein